MPSLRLAVGAFALIFTGACAPKIEMKDHRRTVAPQGAGDLGVLIQGARSEDLTRLVEAHPEAQIRTLNEALGLFEVFNVPLQQVQRDYDGLAEANRWIATNPAQEDAQRVPMGLQIGDLDRCLPSLRLPNPVLHVVAPQNLRAYGTIQLGDTVEASGDASTSDNGALKLDFALITPQYSNLQHYVQTGSHLKLKPDMVGTYSLILIAQDRSHACAMDVLQFMVTAHPPYRGPQPFKSPVDLNQFPHLNQVSAKEAWKISQGEGQVIAFVDSGVDYNSPFLSDQFLINEQEIPENDVDDEGNGFIDDQIGHDFVNHHHLPFDDGGHGTHTAALAVAHGFGIAPKAKIIPIKALTPLGGDLGSIAAAIRYAVVRGATIINLSVGADVKDPPEILRQALLYAQTKNVLVITAAGNGDPRTGLGYNIDNEAYYPASFHLSNMITVAAFDADATLSTYSNFGPKTVDVAAPGGNWTKPILSLATENPQGQVFTGNHGTSMAAPIVAGIAALVRSHAPTLTLAQVRNVLLSAGPHVTDIENIVVSGRHIDALSALQISEKPNVSF